MRRNRTCRLLQYEEAEGLTGLGLNTTDARITENSSYSPCMR
jgi:hypothetical protein